MLVFVFANQSANSWFRFEFLGHVVSSGSVRPTPSKLKTVLEFPVPENVISVQQFVGLANYYSEYIQHFRAKARPITQLTRKGIDFVWNAEQQQAFDTLHAKLTNEPILSINEPDLPTILQTDASGTGLTDILMQKSSDDHMHVISNWFRSSTDDESRYAATKLECYAVVLLVEHFHVYLDGTHFDVFTDCAALIWLFAVKNPKSRLFRLAVRLGVYDYTVHYRPGAVNQSEDALSRNPTTLLIDIDLLQAIQSEIDVMSIRRPFSYNGLIKVKYGGIERVLLPGPLRCVVLEPCHDDLNYIGKTKTQRLIYLHSTGGLIAIQT